jgi:two-component system sensor histidine kinase VicK
VSNAFNYTPKGGSITVSVEQKDNTIITHVSDTGHGIPKEALPHLFSKFYRVHQSPDKASQGTGLGLYISKAIITMHRGKIWVESEEGKGSTFSFSIPIISQAEEHAAPQIKR